MAAGHRRIFDQRNRRLGTAQRLLAERPWLHQLFIRGRLGERRRHRSGEPRSGGEEAQRGRAEFAAGNHPAKSSNGSISGPLASLN